MAIKGYLVHNLIHKEVPFFATQIEAWIKAFKSCHATLKTVDNLHAYDVIKKEKPNFVLFWDKDIALAYELINLGVKVFNNVDALRLCDDKAYTYAMLIKNKIPTPKTMVMPLTFYQNGIKHFSLIKQKLKEHHLTYPFVVKERCNSLGLGVYLIKNDQELKKIFKDKWDKHLLIQEFISAEPGKDYRVYVINHRPKAVVVRCNKKDFRSNVHQGGKMTNLKNPDSELLKVAIRSSLAVNLDFGAIDIVKDKNGHYLVLEINSNARTATIDQVAKTPLTRSVAKYILNNI